MQNYIIGIDEVGRGPLAGPITVAAFAVTANHKFRILNPQLKKILKNIKDSKQLTPKKRLEWHNKLIKHAGLQNIAISSIGSATIDKISISVAARLAVERCLKKMINIYGLKTVDCKILLDGSLYAPRIYQNQKTIIKGDEKIPIIAAASIIAKVKRDRHMVRMHKKFPQYGFAIHKGYGTQFHQEAIKTHGLCAIHRRTFCKKFV